MNDIRVLIVDDIPQVRKGLATILQLAGQKAGASIKIIGEAKNGKEALRMAQEQRPDVILMDLEMPGMNGLEATIRIKEALPGTRLIILTIHSNSDMQRLAREAGADGFLVKGVNALILLEAVLSKNGTYFLSDPDKGDEL